MRARLASDFLQHWPELLLRVPPEGARVHLLTATPDDKAVSAALVGKLDRGSQVFRGEHLNRRRLQLRRPPAADAGAEVLTRQAVLPISTSPSPKS